MPVKTSVVISNITWNTPEFFRRTSQELVANGILDWVHAVPHRPESDEKKAHIHFVLKPAKSVDTVWLAMRYSEYQDGDPLPLKPTSDWRKVGAGRMRDWLLYSLHDEDYLAEKLERRQHHYTLKDCISTDEQSLEIAYKEAKRENGGHIGKIKKAFEMGVSLDSLLLSGAIPLALHRSAVNLWQILEERKVYRNGRPAHEQEELIFQPDV